MASNTVVTISFIEEGNIDRDRIVDDHLVPDEYFCPICQYLLWKPRSCSSCQHLFCQKCIQTWIENTNNVNKCPFRCQSYEERRCPPYVQSLLSRLNIRCRNSSFGCTEILSYDNLEHHENVECKYLSKTCSECKQSVLVSKLNEHQEVKGLCIPQPIKCTICQNHIEKSIFREHFHECCLKRINELNQRAVIVRNIQTLINGQQITPPNPVITYFQNITNTMALIDQQKQLSRLPINLKGADAVRRVRETNSGHFYHMLVMLKFVLLNWTKIPFFLFSFGIGGFGAIGVLLAGAYTLFSHWAYTHIHAGPFSLILFPYLLCYGTSILFQNVSDTTMFLCFGIFVILCVCLNRISLELMEIDTLFNKPILCIVYCCLATLIIKIILLLIRLYYWLMPTYIGAGVITLINFYVSYKTHYVYSMTISRTTNQQMMPV